MTPSKMPVPPYARARVAPIDHDARLTEGPVAVRPSPIAGDFDLIQKGVLTTVAPKNRADGDALAFALSTGRAALAWLDAVAADGSAELQLALFNGPLVEMGAVDVGLDEAAEARVAQALGRRRASLSELIELVTEACAVVAGEGEDDRYFLFTAGAAADSEFTPEGEADGDPAAAPAVPPVERSFCIHGDGVRLAVSRRQKARDEHIFLASRITRARSGRPDNAVRLARGRLTFSDYTRTGLIRVLASGQMTKLLAQQSSYLRRWDEYGAAEGEVLLERARAVGVLRFDRTEPGAAGKTTLILTHLVPPALEVGDELEITDAEPPYLKDRSMDWAAFCALLDAEAPGGKRGGAEKRVRAESVKVTEVGGQSVTVGLQVPPDADRGLLLVLSMSGERTQIKRRMEARRNILEGRSANPLLGVIIEEGGDVPDQSRPPRIAALSAFVRKKVFPTRGPTEAQEEAIRVALNTPDIALIQGPPGTGKTTVIAAILERLNELSDKRGSVRGQVLLTGFQHDAVENLMLRLTVNSLPVPKFGRRSGDDAEGDPAAERLRQWCDQVAARLREANPALAQSDRERELVLLCHQYRLAPSLDHAAHLLDTALQLPRAVLGGELAQRLLGLKEVLDAARRAEAGGDGRAAPLARALRVTADGFADDGPARAADVLDGCDDLAPDEIGLLERAAEWRDPGPTPFLAELKRLKGELAERFEPRPAFRVEKARDDVLRLMAEVLGQVGRRGLGATDRTAAVLSDFLAALESDPAAVAESVAEYSYAFAATCQQSAGRLIGDAKRGRSGDGPASYDTVIVDEAARVGPRDLLVPMAQARRRIILVGDDRQLPHLIDEEVERALESSAAGLGATGARTEDDLIKQSMFQYLKGRLGALRQRDGIRRHVILDQQFRMHRVLGEYVSRTFYAPHGEGFGSPRPDDHFAHALPGAGGAPAAWLDVPAERGRPDRPGTSWRRRAEADRIAAQLHEWIDAPAGKDLSFGVIAFYKAQVDAIHEALARYGYACRSGDNSWVVDQNYATWPARDGRLPEERLRVGTVDAFQGMEFDIVFLSIVRCRAPLPPCPDTPAEIDKEGRGLFGHLMSVNRLCVSMSRQKRLLVAVGDAGMVTNDIARHCVPGLAGFHDLCQEKGVVLK